jgi:signal transduction histidine kinase
MKAMNRRPALGQARWLNLAAALLVSGWRGQFDIRIAGVGAAYAAFTLLEAYLPGWAQSTFAARAVRRALDFLLPMALIAATGGFQSPLWWSLSVAAASASLAFGLWLGAGLGVFGWLAAGGALILTHAGPPADAFRIVWTTVSGLAATMAMAWLSRVLAPAPAPSKPSPKAGKPSETSTPAVVSLLDLVAQADAGLSLEELALRLVELVEAAVMGERARARPTPAGLWIGLPEEGAWAGTRGFAPARDRTPSGGHTVFQAKAEGGDPVYVRQPGDDRFLGQWTALSSRPWVTVVPLAVPPEAAPAAVILGLEEAPPVDSPDLVAAVARQAGRIWTDASRYQALLNERERFNELQEEARRRLARNLHDGPTQSIASIAMRANFARRQIARDPKIAAQEIAKVEDMARQITREIRNMLFTLRPLILESQGLGPALYQLALKAREAEEEEINLEIDPEATAGLEPGVQGALFYIVEEAVHNVQKHAAAENIWIRLKQGETGLHLEIEDDGVGFNVGAVDANYEQRGSLGMVNMRERAELAGGSLSVRSTEGQGTCISVTLPRPEDNAADHG